MGKVNPFAVCKSQQKKSGMSDKKTERCIKKLKTKGGRK